MYALEMGSGVMIYIPSSTEIDSGIQNLIWGEQRDTQERTEIV
jgi:hypothetical protein